MAPIRFFSHDVVFSLSNPSRTRRWLTAIASEEKQHLQSVDFIFCPDEYLLGLNEDYLNHTTLTDIITFDLSEPGDRKITGEIYISLDRVFENALKFRRPFLEELHRVMAHGLLHLCGYGDKTAVEKRTMRQKEDFYLMHPLVPRGTFL